MKISLMSERGYTEQHDRHNEKIITAEKKMNNRLSFILGSLLEKQDFLVCSSFYTEMYNSDVKQLKLKERHADIAITINCRIHENEITYNRSNDTVIYINRKNPGDSEEFARKVVEYMDKTNRINEKHIVQRGSHKITDCNQTGVNSSIVIQQSYLLSSLSTLENEYFENKAEAIVRALCDFLKLTYVDDLKTVTLIKEAIVREYPTSKSYVVKKLHKDDKYKISEYHKGWGYIKELNGWLFLRGNTKENQ